MAVANSLIAVKAVRYRYRALSMAMARGGNANLCTIIPNLQLKWNASCVPENQIKPFRLIPICQRAGQPGHNEKGPICGTLCIAHKGGMHIDAIRKNPLSFEHIRPELVGNEDAY